MESSDHKVQVASNNANSSVVQVADVNRKTTNNQFQVGRIDEVVPRVFTSLMACE